MELQPQFNEAWAFAAQEQLLTRGDMLFLALNRAMNSFWVNESQLLIAFSKEIQKSFTPVTNQNKISNGYTPWKAVELALSEIKDCPGWFYLSDEEAVQYLDILEALVIHLLKQYNEGVTAPELPSDDYLYIVVRKDLSPEQQVVQAAHAAFIAGVKFNDNKTKDIDPEAINFVVLHAEDEDDLLDVFEYNTAGYDFDVYSFYEIDQRQFTALSTAVVNGSDRNAFKDRKLLKFDDQLPVEIVFKPEESLTALSYKDVPTDQDGVVFVNGWGAFDPKTFTPIVIGSGDQLISEINEPTEKEPQDHFIRGAFHDAYENGYRPFLNKF